MAVSLRYTCFFSISACEPNTLRSLGSLDQPRHATICEEMLLAVYLLSGCKAVNLSVSHQIFLGWCIAIHHIMRYSTIIEVFLLICEPRFQSSDQSKCRPIGLLARCRGRFNTCLHLNRRSVLSLRGRDHAAIEASHNRVGRLLPIQTSSVCC